MRKLRKILVPALLLPLSLGLAACRSATDGGDATTAQAAGGGVPTFQVDPSWPKEMPDLWIMGSVTSVFVDANDHVWVTHLPATLTPEETSAVQDPPPGECCAPAPVVIEFDAEGNVVQGWGDPATQDVSEFPQDAHGLFIDHNDNVWVGTYRHHRVMKFTRDGQALMTIGEYDNNAGSNDTALLGGPAGIWVDPEDNEIFIADGYRNRRVIVFDADSGDYLRHWGAYGEVPDDEYRYQVFQQDGEFVMEKIIAPETRSSGSAFVIQLSPDPEQEWLYLADGTNHKVWILRRADLEIVGSFGRGGRQVGQMRRPHGMGIDSHGNLYVGEASTGRRVQKFTVSGSTP